jgi:hypothetical protein
VYFAYNPTDFLGVHESRSAEEYLLLAALTVDL